MTHKLLKAADEAVEVAKGERPAARITVAGHAYVPESEIARLTAERDLWQSRCLGAVSLLPDEMKCGELQVAAKDALAAADEIDRLKRELLSAQEDARRKTSIAVDLKRERDAAVSVMNKSHSDHCAAERDLVRVTAERDAAYDRGLKFGAGVARERGDVRVAEAIEAVIASHQQHQRKDEQ